MPERPRSPAFPDPRVYSTLTVPAAGVHLGLGRSQAYAAAARGEIPTIRVGSPACINEPPTTIETDASPQNEQAA